MRRKRGRSDSILDAQTAGPLVVLGAFAASEASARLLDACPSSAFAWYLNLEIFRPFEIARGAVTPLRLLMGPDALTVDLVLIAVVVLARLARFRLGIALLANLGFGAAVALAYACCGTAPSRSASLAGIGMTQTFDATLAVLLAASFAAFLVSHAAFLRDILRTPEPGLDTGSTVGGTR